MLVHVHLDGQATLDAVAKHVQSLQGQVLDRNESYRHGILAAYVPTDQLENIAKAVGVRADDGTCPVVRVGKYTSQSCAVLQTDKLNNRGLKRRWHHAWGSFRRLKPEVAGVDGVITTFSDLPIITILSRSLGRVLQARPSRVSSR